MQFRVIKFAELTKFFKGNTFFSIESFSGNYQIEYLIFSLKKNVQIFNENDDDNIKNLSVLSILNFVFVKTEITFGKGNLSVFAM